MKKKLIISLITPLLYTLFFWFFASPIQAAEWKEIKERGYLIVGVKDNLRPLGFRDQNGNLQGLEIDIAKGLAKELLGSEDAIKFVPVSNSDRLNFLLTGKVDLVIARLTVTRSRSRVVDFTRPYYMDGTGLITKNPHLKNINNITLDKIAVLNGSDTIAVIKNIFPQADLIGVNSYQEAFLLLENNQIMAFAADNSILAGWVKEYPQYHLVPARLSGEPLSIAIPRGVKYNELWTMINSAIARWQKEKWLQEKIKYWELPE